MTSARFVSPNRDSRNNSSVAAKRCSAFSYSASSRVNLRTMGTSAFTAGRIRSAPCGVKWLSTGRSLDCVSAHPARILQSCHLARRTTVFLVVSQPRSSWRRSNRLEGNVQYRVVLPVLVIVMPPLRLVGLESFRFHGPPQQIAEPARLLRTPSVSGMGPLAHLVIFAGHGHFPSAGKIDEGQGHCAPP